MINSKIANGIYTLINKDAGTYITIKIHTALQGNLKGKRIVSKLIGPDNEHSYKGFAFVTDDDHIIVWRSQQSQKTLKTVVILRDLILFGDQGHFADKVTIELSKRCLRCNRRLTTPQSIADGIGPLCIKKL